MRDISHHLLYIVNVSFIFCSLSLAKPTVCSCKYNNCNLTYICKWIIGIYLKCAFLPFSSLANQLSCNLPFLRLQNLNQRIDWRHSKPFLNMYTNNKCYPNKNGFHWHTEKTTHLLCWLPWCLGIMSLVPVSVLPGRRQKKPNFIKP